MRKPKVAFIGSGGATRGVAHLGVLKALEDIGVAPDIYVGSSTGAVVAAFAAQGIGADEMVDWLRPPWSRRDRSRAVRYRDFFGAPNAEQWASPGYLTSGAFSIDRFEKFLASTLPSNDFRRLERALIVTATDVDGRGRAAFGVGYDETLPISRAVAASCCVPVVFRPYRIADRYFVDGEITRTLSIDLAIEAGADVVVVSNVYRPHVTRVDEPSVAHRGPFWAARQALNIVLSEKEKRGIDLVARTAPHVTVLDVSPDLGRFPFTRRLYSRSMLTRGYREALKVLATAKQRGTFEVCATGHALGEA